MGGLRVLRMFKKAVGKGFLGQGVLIPQHARYKANRRVDQDLSGQFPAGQDIIADADFLDPVGIKNALVDTDRGRAVRVIEQAVAGVLLLIVGVGIIYRAMVQHDKERGR